MTALVEMASVPPWRQSVLDKKRRGEDSNDLHSQAGVSLGDPTSARKRDILTKTQISERSFFYSSHSGQSSARDLNRNDARSVGTSLQARPSEKDVETLANFDSTEWNLQPTVAGDRDSNAGRVSLNSMVSQSKQQEVNANGPTASSTSVVNGVLVDEERIGSVHDNPFVKNFGLKHVIKPASSVHGSGGDLTVNSSVGNRLSEADMPEMEEEDYRPGSGFVHKILDKFALLTAKEEAHRPGLNHHLRMRSSSLENLVDNEGHKPANRKSIGDEVFTTSPKSNFQYYSKAKSVESLVHKGTSERSSSDSFESKRRSGSELREHGRHRSGSDLRRSHPAPDANLAREDIIIIETTPSPRPSDEDPLKKASRRRRTSSSERQLEKDELPKPNTVSSYRKKFESARIEKNDVLSKQRKKKDRPQNVPVNSTVSNHSATNGSKHKQVDNLPDVIKVNGESSRDSSFDTQTDLSGNNSLDGNYPEKDFENPVYDAIRASLRHVKPGKDEEITYSWKRHSGSDQIDEKSNISVSSGNIINNANISHGSSTVSNIKVPIQHNDVAPKPAATTSTTTPSNNSGKVSSVSYKSLVNDSEASENVKKNNTPQQRKTENSGQEKPTASIRKSIAGKELKQNSSSDVMSSSSKVEKTDGKDSKANVSDAKEVTTSVNSVSVTNQSSVTTSSKGPAPKPPTVSKVSEAVVNTAPVASSQPKVMVNVGPKTTNDSDGSSYRSRNRFSGAEKEDQKTVHAGKTWFYQAGKFKANPEGVKRPNSSKAQAPVPKKRTSPAPPGVTVLNLTEDSSDGPITPRSNIDDVNINGDTQDIPVTDIDVGSDNTQVHVGSGARGNGVVPRLDLSVITDNKKSAPSPRGSPAQKKVQPCNYEFAGSHVVIGKGLLQTKKKAQKVSPSSTDCINVFVYCIVIFYSFETDIQVYVHLQEVCYQHVFI